MISSNQTYLVSDPISQGQMMVQTAQVIACDAHQIHLMIPLQRCQSCQGHCGVAWLARLWPRRADPLKIARDRVPFPVQVGDQVTLTMHQAVLDRAVWHLYGWPLGGLLSGGMTGAGLGGELLSVLLGLLGLGAGLLYAKGKAPDERLHHINIIHIGRNKPSDES